MQAYFKIFFCLEIGVYGKKDNISELHKVIEDHQNEVTKYNKEDFLEENEGLHATGELFHKQSI